MAVLVAGFGNNAQISVVGNTFTANDASTQGGGALYFENLDDVYVEANSFCGNGSAIEGGAAFLLNSGADTHEGLGNLFVDNTSVDIGGGLAFDNADQPQVITTHSPVTPEEEEAISAP